MDPLWILTAFILGFIGFRLGLPPMVGYLIAGFVLQAFGVEGGESLETIADLGVLLLLFSIGLKLHLRDLIRPEIWAGAGGKSKIRLVLLAMPEHTANIAAVQQLNRIQFDGKIAATAKYEDEVEALRQAGARAAYYFYAEAGYGFAEHVCQELGDQLKLRTDKE